MSSPGSSDATPSFMSQDESPNRKVCGIILAGTYPWTNSRFDRLLARPLLPVAHRPLITYALSSLRQAGITRIAVCGNRNTETLEDWLAQREWDDAELSYLQDPMPRGSGGCVLDVAALDDSQTFVVTDGTSLSNLDLTVVLDRHRQADAAASVVIYSGHRGSGERRPHMPVGVYVFEAHTLRSIPRKGFRDIKEHLIPALVNQGEKVVTFETADAPLRVWNEDSYLRANEFAMSSMSSFKQPPAGYERRGEALIHCDASVSDDVVMAGPVVIAPGALVEPGAVVIGPTSIGVDVTVEPRALISRSAVWRRSTIRAGAVVDRAVIGDDSVV
jgi:NDP-sugar pyrophosphorylase family protein